MPIVYDKGDGENMKKRIFNIIAIAITCIAALPLLGFIVLFLWMGGWPYKSFFDQNLWLKNAECVGNFDCANRNDSACVRGGMVGDLKWRYLHSGLPRSEIEDLLGKNYTMQKYGEQLCMDYNIGMCSGFKMDYDSLVLCLGKDGALSDYFTVQH